MGRLQRAALVKQLKCDGRGRHCERHAHDDRAARRQPKRRRREADDYSRNRELRQPQPEDILPHCQQAAQLQLEPDDEEQQDDAEFGHGPHGVGVREQLETRWSDGDACHQIADDGPQARAVEHRYGDYRAGAEDQDRDQEARFSVFGHAILRRLGGYAFPRTLKVGGAAIEWGGARRPLQEPVQAPAPREASEGRQTPSVDRNPAKACLTLLPVRHTNARRRPKTGFRNRR